MFVVTFTEKDKSTKFCMKILQDLLINIRRGATSKIFLQQNVSQQTLVALSLYTFVWKTTVSVLVQHLYVMEGRFHISNFEETPFLPNIHKSECQFKLLPQNNEKLYI